MKKNITDWNKVMAKLGGSGTGKARRIDVEDMKAKLKERVKGQDEIIDDLCDYIYTQWGKENRSKPIANVLFLGPTGTGKTELALALAAYLYDDEANLLGFDCGELQSPESITRLIGMPAGYEGTKAGGQLTRPVITNPKRIVVFDEIEKAFSRVNDLFLSMMDKGRVTEAAGKVADFTQCVIILTSNAEFEAIAKLEREIKDPNERVQAIKDQLAEAGTFRPEIVARIDKIYVFKPLPREVMATIVVLKVTKLAHEYGLELEYVDADLVVEAVEKSEARKKFGVRELTRVVNDMFSRPLVMAKEAGHKHISVTASDDGVLQVLPAEPEADEAEAAPQIAVDPSATIVAPGQRRLDPK